MNTLCGSTLYVSTLCGSTLYVSTLCVTTLCEHSMGALYEHRKVRKVPRKMNISSWAGCGRTPKRTKITRKNEHQFLGRMLQNTEKYENYQETSTSVLGPDVVAPQTSKMHEFYCKNPVQAHRRTPKSTRITTKNEHRRS